MVDTNESNDVRDVMLEVDFIAGRIRVPLEKLAKWVPQHIVSSEEGVFYPRVQAVCNGAIIAEGELVRVGSQIGFRVQKIIGESG